MLYRLIPFALAISVFAQEPAAPAAPAAPRAGERSGSRTPLFFRETWKTVTAEQAGSQLQTVGKADDPSNPPHVWTGLCTAPTALALRDKDSYVDLTGLARIH